ncbi:MAG: molybdate ABC transporter substrate-binding protein [Alphaproteobacteria bacterium]
MKRLRRALAALAALVAASPVAAEPLIFAAASTKRAMDAVIAASGVDATLSYGTSGTLARQIAAGAPADLYLAANPEWLAYLVEEGVVDAADVQPLLSNALVLIVPAGAPPLALTGDELDARLDGEHFAMADPATAPVGEYGRVALETLGLWEVVGPRLVPTRNTLVTVATVGAGEAPVGLVYRSDARDVARVAVAAEIPTDTHPRIAYPATTLAGGADPAGAARLMAFMTSADGRALFERHGFRVADAGP